MSSTSESEGPGEAPKPKLSLRLKKNGDADKSAEGEKAPANQPDKEVAEETKPEAKSSGKPKKPTLQLKREGDSQAQTKPTADAPESESSPSAEGSDPEPMNQQSQPEIPPETTEPLSFAEDEGLPQNDEVELQPPSVTTRTDPPAGESAPVPPAKADRPPPVPPPSVSTEKSKKPEDEQVTQAQEASAKHGLGFFLAAGGIGVLILGLLVLAFYLLTFLFPGEGESPEEVVTPVTPVTTTPVDPDPPATTARPSAPEAPAGGVSVDPRVEEIPAQLAAAEVGENPEIETFLEGLGTIQVLEDSTQAFIVVRNVAYAVGDLVEPHTGLRVAAIHLDESLVYFVDGSGERYALEF